MRRAGSRGEGGRDRPGRGLRRVLDLEAFARFGGLNCQVLQGKKLPGRVCGPEQRWWRGGGQDTEMEFSGFSAH